MNPEKQRIAIAGHVLSAEQSAFLKNAINAWCHVGAAFIFVEKLYKIKTDYLNDLNAMHEAWKSLTEYQHKSFRDYLRYIVLRDEKLSGHPSMSVCNATAAQRAEAFLKTIGKWGESE